MTIFDQDAVRVRLLVVDSDGNSRVEHIDVTVTDRMRVHPICTLREEVKKAAAMMGWERVTDCEVVGHLSTRVC